jgi:hypothetical protein
MAQRNQSRPKSLLIDTACDQCEALRERIVQMSHWSRRPYEKPQTYEQACYMLRWQITLSASEGALRREALDLAGRFEKALGEALQINVSLRQENETLHHLLGDRIA